jgi:hypothetical protein
MGLPGSPNSCTKVKWASLWRCRRHLLYFGAADLCSKSLNFSTPRDVCLPCSITGLFRLQSSETAFSGTGRGLGQLPGPCPARGGGVAELEQRGGKQRESPVGAAGGGRRGPGAPPWCGCCSSPTPVLGAAATRAACGSPLDYVPRAAASLGSSSGARSSTAAPVRPGVTPPRACEKPFEIDPVRDAVARYLVQTGATSQNRDGFHGFSAPFLNHQLPLR